MGGKLRAFFRAVRARHGDYAIVGLAAQAIVERDLSPILVSRSLPSRSTRITRAAKKLINVAITPAVLSDASTALAEESIPSDQQASASCAGICEGVAGPLRRRVLGRPTSMPEDLRERRDANLADVNGERVDAHSCRAQSRRLLASICN